MLHKNIKTIDRHGIPAYSYATSQLKDEANTGFTADDIGKVAVVQGTPYTFYIIRAVSNGAPDWQLLGDGSGGGGVSLTGVTYGVSPFLVSLGFNTPTTSTGVQNTAIGAYSLKSITTGQYNTAVGAHSLENNLIGYSCIAIGASSLQHNTASNNVAVGNSSLNTNTTGTFNTAIGHRTLVLNDTGHHNTAVGNQSLYSNLVDNNTAVGSLALYNNALGTDNIALGYNALYNNTSGTDNIAIGNNTLLKNSLGSYNIAIGNTAIGTTAAAGLTDNIAIGYHALVNTTGNSNTIIGNNAGNSLAGGSLNTFVGYNAGLLTTSGSNNVIIGANSSHSSGSNNTIIGYNATTPVVLNNTIMLSAGSTLKLKIDTHGIDCQGNFLFNYFNKNGYHNGATYTLSDTDNNSILRLTNAITSSAITLTIPATLTPGFRCTVVQYGNYVINFVGDTTVVLESFQNRLQTKGMYSAVEVRVKSTSTFVELSGDLGPELKTVTAVGTSISTTVVLTIDNNNTIIWVTPVHANVVVGVKLPTNLPVGFSCKVLIAGEGHMTFQPANMGTAVQINNKPYDGTTTTLQVPAQSNPNDWLAISAEILVVRNTTGTSAEYVVSYTSTPS